MNGTRLCGVVESVFRHAVLYKLTELSICKHMWWVIADCYTQLRICII